MSVYDAVKDALTIAQKADNVELIRTLLDVQKEALDLQEDNRRLKEENGRLMDVIEDVQKLVFRDDCYYFDDDGPYCSRCYDVEKKKVRMVKRDTGMGSIYNKCPNCNNEVLKETYDISCYI